MHLPSVADLVSGEGAGCPRLACGSRMRNPNRRPEFSGFELRWEFCHLRLRDVNGHAGGLGVHYISQGLEVHHVRLLD
ncbi:MAG: hypothetical protein L3J95_05110 [Thermoplasmata archaeon]|nr:hypothetical protein [Thermoplasmata archaeon]MCI4359780.1 hypothetical protein [Thermoplasmata archaeon]